MKRATGQEIPSVFYLGKGVIIFSIVITSSLSFILGFFVGKNMQPSVNQSSVITPVEDNDYNTEPQERGTVSQQSQQPQELQNPEEPQNTRQVQQPKEDKLSQDTQRTALLEPSQPKPAKDSIKLQAARETKTTKSARESQKISNAKKYTVQAGAFKDPSDADSLNAKFVKKGYKAFTRTSKTKNQEKLYKVMVGEFSTRDEAEVFSIKLRKSEGLRTFVILTPGQEAIRQP